MVSPPLIPPQARGDPPGQASPGPYNEMWVEPYGAMLLILKIFNFFCDNDIVLKGKEVHTLERSSTSIIDN